MKYKYFKLNVVLISFLIFVSCTDKIDNVPIIKENNSSTTINSISNYYFSLLDEEEKIVYKEIVYALDNIKQSIEVSSIDDEKINNAYRSVVFDNPKYFYVDGCQLKTYTVNGITNKIEFYPTYSYEKKIINDKIKKISEVVLHIIDKAQIKENEYEKAKYIFEKIIDITNYNINAYNNQDIESVFLQGESVCAGYAKATQYLLNLLNIEASYITGEDLYGVPHAWNYVKLDGEYYYMDTTFGEPNYIIKGDVDVEELQKYLYEYLAMTEEKALETRKFT